MNVDKITNIEIMNAHDSMKYDIHVKDNNNFYANGILVHNCQNLMHKIGGPWYEEEFECTMKLDGFSITVYHNNGNVGVCSRNWDLDLGEENKNNNFVKAAMACGLPEILKAIGKNVAVQGELMGPGVQGNREGLSELKIFVFDVFDIDTQSYYNAYQRVDFIDEIREVFDEIGLPEWTTEIEEVPGLGIISLSLPPGKKYMCPAHIMKDPRDINSLLEFARGPSIKHAVREGVVFKCIQNPSISFKVINNDFLEQGGD